MDGKGFLRLPPVLGGPRDALPYLSRGSHCIYLFLSGSLAALNPSLFRFRATDLQNQAYEDRNQAPRVQ